MSLKNLHLRPRLGRRARKRRLGLWIVVFLALSALAGWLLYLVMERAAVAPISSGLISNRLMSPTALPLAMAPMTLGQGVAFGLGWLVIAGAVVTWAMRKARRNEKERARNFRTWAKKGGQECPRSSEEELRWSEESDGPVEIRTEDLRGIIWALTAEACTARENVVKAQGNLSVEDYGETLAGAERSLNEMIRCLGGVMESLNAHAARGGRRP